MRPGLACRAVVTDLDGTVVLEDGSVSPATVTAAGELAGRGIPLIAATGRTPAGVAALESLLPHLTIAVCCGGAIGWRPASGEVLWREAIAAATVRDIARLAVDRLPAAGIAAYDGAGWRMTERYSALRGAMHRGPKAVVPAADIANQPACAMFICHPTMSSEELMRAFDTEAIDDPPTLTYATTNLVDIAPARVDKCTGVRRALSTLDVVPAQSIAFGDMPNDIPMFRLCGQAVAVANAHTDVLAAATTVGPCVHNDGFSRVLGQLGTVYADQAQEVSAEPRCGCGTAAQTSSRMDRR